MREDWDYKQLGDIGKVSMCKRIYKKETSSSGDIPFYKIGTFGKEPDAFISKDLYDEYRSKYSYPNEGDVLISASGTIGRRVVYNGEPAYFQDSNIVWIANDETEVLNEYLYAFYGYCDWNPSKGATISRLYNDDLRKTRIPIPPLPEQKRIVEILDEAFEAIDQARANVERNIQNAEELFQSKLNEIFVGLYETYEISTIGEIFDTSAGGTPKKSNIDYYENGSIPWLRSGEVKQGDILETEILITEKGLAESSAKLFPENTVLVAMYGATAGDVGILRLEASTNQAVCGILPNEQHTAEFIYYLIRYKRDILVKQAIGNAQPNLSQTKIKKLDFPIVPVSKQKEVVLEIGKISDWSVELSNSYSKRLKSLEELKKSILQKAFSGELTANEHLAV